MRSMGFGSLLALLLFVVTEVPAAQIDPGLSRRLSEAPADAELPVLLRLEERLDLGSYRGREDAGRMIRDLREHAARSQAPLLARLSEWGLTERTLPLWIDNCIALRLTAER
ncbi:MAG: hypothetical protein FJY75_03035, partial [Candidatus Eisenbacteria bacterium]|nr:hypothetical protein [Candidatus Eisenbacteria bacterium]